MTAIQATFSDFKTVKTRKVAQLVFEIPIEQSMMALEALGGVPVSATEQWVGIAPIRQVEAPEKPKVHFKDKSLAQQAGILCANPQFWAFIDNGRSDDNLGDELPMGPIISAEMAANWLRITCGIKSRAELDTDQRAEMYFRAIKTDFDAYTGRIPEQR